MSPRIGTGWFRLESDVACRNSYSFVQRTGEQDREQEEAGDRKG